MGRPLSKKYFSNPANTGKQIVVTSAFIPGNVAAVSDAYIVAQKGVSKYIVYSPSTSKSGLVHLTAGSATAEGEAYIEVTPFGSSVDYAKQICAHTVKTFGGSVYRWSTEAASKEGESNITLA